MSLGLLKGGEPIDLLLGRARALYGLSLGALALKLHIELPSKLTGHKGLVGQMLEKSLGASAGSQPLPDFPELGIELKTIPVDSRGIPSESTYVCKVPFVSCPPRFLKSVLYKKLRHVLFVPIQADKNIPLKDRKIGYAFYWQMDVTSQTVLEADWTELMAAVSTGRADEITGHWGKWLQIRPKARNNKVRVKMFTQSGLSELNPKGFYLRTIFTRQLLEHHALI